MLRWRQPLFVALPLLVGCTPDAAVRFQAPAGATVLVGGSVYLGDGITLDDALVVLDGGTIAAVAPRPTVEFTLPESVKVVDVTGRTILPGLIDLHTHLTSDGCFTGKMSEPRLRRQLRANLYSGVTTVLDLGSTPWLRAERAKALSEEWDSPEILIAGPMITAPGGHPIAAEGRFAGMARRVSGTEAARLAVADIAENGSDVVKAVIEGGGFGGMGRASSLGAPELRAIAEEAHARGLKLFVHVSTAADARIALDAGADVLAHVPISEPLPPELVARLATEGRASITTLTAFEGFFRLLDDPGYVDTPAVADHVDPEVIEACRGADVVSFADSNPFTVFARDQIEVARDNVNAMRAAGAPIVLGTDAGNLYVFHGPAVHRELALLVEAGLSASEAIDAASVKAADALGRHDIGSVRPGRRADLLIVAGNPAQRIADLADIEIVIRAGRFYDRSAL